MLLLQAMPAIEQAALAAALQADPSSAQTALHARQSVLVQAAAELISQASPSTVSYNEAEAQVG